MAHRPDQSTIERPDSRRSRRQQRGSSPQPPRRHRYATLTDSAARRWDEEVRRAGLEAPPSKAMNTGVPLIAIAILVLALILAVFAPENGDVRPVGVLILLLAIAPWCFWLYVGDEGPHWQAIFGLLFPIGLLGIGHWFIPTIGPGSDLAYPALVFPPLLLTIIAVALAPTRIAIGTATAAYMVIGGPLLTALVAGKDITGTEIVTWHVAMALSIIAGYAIRFSNQAHTAVTIAREMIVRQEASEERRQIARDVHDVIAHSLSVTMLHVTAARLALNRQDTAAARHALEEAERLGRASMTEVRRIVQVLRADGDSAMDLPQPTADQLGELIDIYRDAGLKIDAQIELDHSRLTETTGMAIYRILQEALTNAARHGNATNESPATVRIWQDGGEIHLTVSNPVRPGSSPQSPGSGIIGMKERTEAAGGKWSSRLEGGTWTITARIPLGEDA